MHNILPALELFARAGGGGSGGGGGRGSGYGLIALAMITYVPSTLMALAVKKRLERKAALMVTAAFGAFFSVAIIIGTLALSGVSGVLVAAILLFGLWLGWYMALFSIWERLLRKRKKADKDIATAAMSDSIWQEDTMLRHAHDVFMRYQSDWHKRDWSGVSEYMTQRYAYHSYLMMRALREMKRINILENPTIIKMDTIAITDSPDDSKDSFSVLIEGAMKDTVVDETTGLSLYVTTAKFHETWTFMRSDSTWLLDNIEQTGTQDIGAADQSLVDFAQRNKLFYSLDWGVLLVPTQGRFFKRHRLAGVDINNHLIGMYGNNLVQLYTYSYVTNSRFDNNRTYVIAQLNLPKSYGSIIVQPRPKFFSFNNITVRVPRTADDGQPYQKHQLEWGSFNAKYTVYASRQDALATFELLNPGFMQFLHDTYPKAIIEVVDNIVYIVAIAKTNDTNYQVMLDILNRAYKELKM